ncbi:MAG: DUF3048 domain-containing protein [Demequinaceae bacterium]|nr:DUF3048 domain-containing protein [Demequinaceae bacterium]
MRVRVGAVVVAVAVMVATACAPEQIKPATVTVTPDPVVTRSPAVEPPVDPIPSVAWPLTGMDASQATAEQRALPAIAIKIPNDPSHSRPQKNLEYADVVFEEYVEAGIPRLIGVFHSTMPDEVGPVRSMREMDPNIVGSLGGPLVFSGANKYVINYAKSTGQKLIAQDIGSDGFFRTKDRPSPYNLHVTIADVLAQSAGLTAPAPQFSFAYPGGTATAVASGTPATHIDLRLSRYGEPKWDWDEASGTWLRTEFTDPDVTVDGTRVSATNVIVMFVTINMSHDLPVSQMIVSNSPGFIATGGKYIPILWSKADRTSPYVLTTEDGTPVTLAPGQTWIELIPNGGIAVGKAEFS